MASMPRTILIDFNFSLPLWNAKPCLSTYQKRFSVKDHNNPFYSETLCNVKNLCCVAKYQNPLRMSHLILHVQTWGEILAQEQSAWMWTPQDGGREQGVLKEDDKAAQGQAVILSVHPNWHQTHFPGPALCHPVPRCQQALCSFSHSTNSHMDKPDWVRHSPLSQWSPRSSAHLAQTSFSLHRLVTMTLNSSSGCFLRWTCL